MRGAGTELQSLGDVAKGTETVLQGMVVILRFRKLRRQFCGAHGGTSPFDS